MEGSESLQVGGQSLDADLLRRFYERRGYRPVWTGLETQAEALVAKVLRAADHGLDPDLFHAPLLRGMETLPTLQRDLILTNAVLSYAAALAHGAVPAERRKGFEALAPRPVDVVEVLDGALLREDPVEEIEALAPQTQTYLALRAMMLAPRRTEAAPAARPRTAAAAAAAAAEAAARLRSLKVNMERERWLPRQLPPDRVWVNIPNQRLVFYRGGRPVFTTRVVVGDVTERNQSPEFDALIEAGFFNPPWVVPRDIVEAEILPRIAREPDYLARNNMVMRPNGEVEQMPGPTAGLGYVLFDMPNRFDVYLHDTPDRFIFSRGNRQMSRGCIRVENPRELAALLMREPIEVIDRKIAQGDTVRTRLPRPVPVFVTYHTAFLDDDGTIQFRPDFYDRDTGLMRRLQGAVEA
ncbi:L,D-transpeptidase family protein [Roseomonas sp. PWR1]|uniref:L,D-transpeptidase family protein n=1 Tax=Roseomonas nitratireducens TaxID=2820810 RepID=A0ABS4ARB8_9PROT|nr:L,D-transpeptidase family protein [Neoroseomonas nitratireducens]MBP0463393.1 L,D-transpeptidase family protein [Neoroseomonas nitratireducens]